MEKQDLAAFLGLLPDHTVVLRLVPGGRIELAQADPSALDLLGLTPDCLGERLEVVFDDTAAEVLRGLARDVVRSRTGGRVVLAVAGRPEVELTVLPVFDLDWTPRYVVGMARVATPAGVAAASAAAPAPCDHEDLLDDLEHRLAEAYGTTEAALAELESERGVQAQLEIEAQRLRSAARAERDTADDLRTELDAARAEAAALREAMQDLSNRSTASAGPASGGGADEGGTGGTSEVLELQRSLADARADAARSAEELRRSHERHQVLSADHAAEIERLQERLDVATDRVDELTVRLRSAEAAHDDAQATASRAAAELAEAHRRGEHLAHEAERLRGAAEAAEAALSDAEQTRRELARRAVELGDTVSELEQELAAARAVTADAQAHNETLASRVAELEDQVAAMDERLDPVTGAGNRKLFTERLEELRAGRGTSTIAVLFLDLDNFKLVNDSLGHDNGDDVLRAVAERLTEALPDGATVARFGGDEFLVAALVDDEDAVTALVDTAREALSRPVHLAGQEIFLTASLGVVSTTDDDLAVDRLVQRADAAVYAAKASGPDRVAVYDDSMHHKANRRLATESQLRRAVERGELVAHYQPIVEMLQGRVVGAEALVRWEHPERGLVSPGEFIPIAEETGLIAEIGELVLDEALATAVGWNRDGLAPWRPLSISVNLSARQLHDAALVQKVQASIERAGIDPELVQLEFTESTLMHEPERMLAMLRDITGLGVAIAIDDFGTGYSSLAYLRDLPAGTVKIDRSFIAGLGADQQDSALVTGIVGLAHALDLEVLAEGVERKQQVKELRRLGCQRAQGFHYSRPLTAAQFRTMLEAGGTLPQELPEGSEHPAADPTAADQPSLFQTV